MHTRMDLRKGERRGRKGEKERRGRVIGWEEKEGGKEAGREEGERVGRNETVLL